MKADWARLGLLLAVMGGFAQAQRPDGPESAFGPAGGPGGPPPEFEGRRGPPGPGDRPPPNPLWDVLDANHDHMLSADELESAAESLRKLDRDQDGALSPDEVRPLRGPGQERGDGPRQREGDGGERLGPPPGRGPRDEGPRGEDDFRPPGPRERFGPAERGPGERFAPGDRGPRAEFGPPAERRPGDGFGPPAGRRPEVPGGGPGTPPGPPAPPEPPRLDPDRFVELALQFDADQNGSLSRDELLAFAKRLPGPPSGARRGDPGARRGPPGDFDRPNRGDRPPGREGSRRGESDREGSERGESAEPSAEAARTDE